MMRLAHLLGLAVIVLWAGRPQAHTVSLSNSPSSDHVYRDVASAGNGQSAIVCTVSEPITDRPPDDPHASSFASANGTWYANEERTLWAWWWGKRSVGDYKVLWVRPVGAKLEITGRRLDRDASPGHAWIPDGYHHTFQATAIAFPTPGCWQVEGTAGAARLTFVVRIP
jgi:hypothetical protein